MQLNFEHSGTFQLFARIEQIEAPTFPMEIDVTSTITDPGKSSVLITEDFKYQICSIVQTYDLYLVDASGDPLT